MKDFKPGIWDVGSPLVGSKVSGPDYWKIGVLGSTTEWKFGTPNASDIECMHLAVDLAESCISETGRVSPKVAAVVVKDGKILGTAFRGEIKSGEHAEYTLLERKLKNVDLTGATLFTTLEPCTHRTHPKVPCTDRVIDRKIKKVVIGTLDPNPVVRGMGALLLQADGLEIEMFEPSVAKRLLNINKDFFDFFPLVRPVLSKGSIYKTYDLLYDRIESCRSRYWAIPKKTRVDHGLRGDYGDESYSGDQVIKVLQELLFKAYRQSYPVTSDSLFFGAVPSFKPIYLSAEDFIRGVEPLLKDLEYRLDSVPPEKFESI